jgi:hypothetical protein
MESAVVIAASARSLVVDALVESGFASSDAATALATLDAWRGTTMNAMSAHTNTSPPAIPITAYRRDALSARAEVHK